MDIVRLTVAIKRCNPGKNSNVNVLSLFDNPKGGKGEDGLKCAISQNRKTSLVLTVGMIEIYEKRLEWI